MENTERNSRNGIVRDGVLLLEVLYEVDDTHRRVGKSRQSRHSALSSHGPLFLLLLFLPSRRGV